MAINSASSPYPYDVTMALTMQGTSSLSGVVILAVIGVPDLGRNTRTHRADPYPDRVVTSDL